MHQDKSDIIISVIIPVYNAGKFLINSVESAEQLKEVGEVILVEDGSKDDSLEKCKLLEKKFAKVRLYTHPGGENRGAGASRNLGIRKSRFDYVAFLDADDWYLPNRFKVSIETFKRSEEVDGVYDAVGTYYEELSNNNIESKLTTITKRIDPDKLFTQLITKNVGHFCTDGIVFKKSCLKSIGMFMKI